MRNSLLLNPPVRSRSRIKGAAGALAAYLLALSPCLAAQADYYLKLETIGVDCSAVAYDEAAGVLTIARGMETSDPEYKYVSIRRYAHHFDGRFLTAADLNNDQRSEIIIPAYAANKLLIIWGHTLDQTTIAPQLYDVGPGPMAATSAELNGTAPRELLIATVGAPQVGVRGWNLVQQAPVTTTTGYPAGFAQEGLLGFATAGSSPGALNPALGFLRRDAGANGRPTLQIFSRNPAPAYGPLNSVFNANFSVEFKNLAAGHPLGGTQPGWFMAWAPGLSQVAMVPAVGGTAQIHDLGTPVTRAHMHHGQHSSGANFLFADGSVRFYDFSSETGFTLRQQLTPPPGESFEALAVDGDTAISLSRADPHLAFTFRVNSNSGAGYAPVNEGVWPAPPALSGQTTVALYTSDPFGASPLLVESFAAGDWATGAQLGGNQVDAVVETFGGTTAGLGNPVAQSLQPAVVPGVGAGVLGNQWERSSSLFYAGSPQANGLAPVAIDPPPGNYPNSIAVTFEPGANVTIHYRVHLGAWQQGVGPVWLAKDATVEYFGEHTSGALSAIQSAAYMIDQPEGADGDGDGVPDAIEILAGGDPTKSDTDGDGASDFAELIAGSNLADPGSKPTSAGNTFDELEATFVWDDELSAVYPADDESLLITDMTPGSSSEAQAAKLPGRAKFSNVTLKRGVMAQKLWLPSNFRVKIGDLPAEPVGPALTALAGIEFPPRPNIPLNLAAADPVAAWRAATQAALDDFHAEPLEFTVGPASTLAGLIFEYWYGQRLVELGRLPNVSARPRLADTPRSPYVGVLAASDVLAIQQPSSINALAHELAHVVQSMNTRVVLEPTYAPLRVVAESFYQQAIDATVAGAPLEAPIEALRRLISGDTLPPGYTSPQPSGPVIALRNLALAAVTPRPQIAATGAIRLHDDRVELQAASGRYLLFSLNGQPMRAPGSAWIVPGSTASVRGFLLAGPPPSGVLGEIEVLEFNVTALPAVGFADLDGNGLPDLWEQVFLGGGGSPLGGDSDGDGFLDPEELGAGTDPLNPLAVPAGFPATPRAMRIEFTPGAGLSLVWDGSGTADYEVWVRSGFAEGAAWGPLSTTVQSTGPQRRVAPIDSTQPQAFYRVGIRFPWLAQP